MRKKIGILLVSMMLVTSFLVVFPVEIVKATRNIVYPTDDTYITQYQNNTNYGTEPLLSTRDYPNWVIQTLIRFDISSIPSGTNIAYAKLNLYYYYYNDGNPVGDMVTAHRITSDWDELTVTWNNQPSYTSEITASNIFPSAPGFWIEWNVTTDVQNYIDGTQSNFGWLLAAHSTSNEQAYFYSKEYGNYIPYLEIEIEPNNPPNKPSKPAGPAAGWTDTVIVFSTSATDPDGDQVKYGWEWTGDNNVDGWTGFYNSGATCHVGLIFDEIGTYYIRVKAKDSIGAVSNWSDIKTVQIFDENQPPNTPNNPEPDNHAKNVDINTNLSWTGGDPDVDDTVTYDVYFGSMQPLQKVASNISTPTYNPGTLANSLTTPSHKTCFLFKIISNAVHCLMYSLKIAIL